MRQASACLPAARRRGPAAAAAGPEPRTAQRHRADRRSSGWRSPACRGTRLLKDAGLVIEEKDGGFTYYRLARRSRSNGLAPLWAALAGSVRTRPPTTRRCKADEARLQEVLRLRKENFDDHAADARDDRQLVPGPELGGVVARARAAAAAAARRRPRLRRRLSRRSKRRAGRRRVIAVDRSDSGARRAHARSAGAAASANVVWKRGELEKLPIDERVGRRGAAVAGAAPRRRSGARRRRSGAHHRAGRPRAGPRSARARRGVGPRRSSATARSDSAKTSSVSC